jgi:addiction module RelE/StbE family toxin
MKVVFDPRAAEDIERIHEFIAADSPVNARAVVDRILTSIEKLGAFPAMARAGRVEGTREWVIPRLPYIAVYKVDEERDILTVIAVFHGAQEREGK